VLDTNERLAYRDSRIELEIPDKGLGAANTAVVDRMFDCADM
jgi:hypothetical protein